MYRAEMGTMLGPLVSSACCYTYLGHSTAQSRHHAAECKHIANRVGFNARQTSCRLS